RLRGLKEAFVVRSYDAETGALRWVDEFAHPEVPPFFYLLHAYDLAVTRGRVIAVGQNISGTGAPWLTRAYDAETGALLWSSAGVFNTLADLLAIAGVPDQLDRERDIVLIRLRNQIRQSDPLQDAARQPPAHETAFPRHDRQPALHGEHRGVVPGKTDRIQKDICAPQPAVEFRPSLPWNEGYEIVEIKPVPRKHGFKPPPQLLRQAWIPVREENESTAAPSTGDFD